MTGGITTQFQQMSDKLDISKDESERLRAGIQAFLDGDHRSGKCQHGQPRHEPCTQCDAAHLQAVLGGEWQNHPKLKEES